MGTTDWTCRIDTSGSEVAGAATPLRFNSFSEHTCNWASRLVNMVQSQRRPDDHVLDENRLSSDKTNVTSQQQCQSIVDTNFSSGAVKIARHRVLSAHLCVENFEVSDYQTQIQNNGGVGKAMEGSDIGVLRCRDRMETDNKEGETNERDESGGRFICRFFNYGTCVRRDMCDLDHDHCHHCGMRGH